MFTTNLFKTTLFGVSLKLFSYSLSAATCVSSGSGSWASGSNWLCGHVPTCGDSVVIQSGHTMTISSQQDLRGCGSAFTLTIYGTLRFVTGNKLRLACNSRVYVFTGGSIVPGGGGGNSNELEICGATVWQAADGTYTGPGCFPSTLTACARVLPVELAVFNVEPCNNENICLSWKTISEHGNSFFEIQRSDGVADFVTRTVVYSKAFGGNSKIPLSYNYTDKAQGRNVWYYRLRQEDYDKSYSFSPVVAVGPHPDRERNADFWIAPGETTISYSLSGFKHSETVLVKVLSGAGKMIFETNLRYDDNEPSGDLLLNINLEPGLYFCLIEYNGFQKVKKMLVH